jgi:hypothetical protein
MKAFIFRLGPQPGPSGVTALQVHALVALKEGARARSVHQGVQKAAGEFPIVYEGEASYRAGLRKGRSGSCTAGEFAQPGRVRPWCLGDCRDQRPKGCSADLLGRVPLGCQQCPACMVGAAVLLPGAGGADQEFGVALGRGQQCLRDGAGRE